MQKKIGFFIKQFTERGGEKAVFYYALYNQEILKNKSIIITLSQKGCKNYNLEYLEISKNKFNNKFLLVEINHIKDMKEIIANYKLDTFYTLSHGGSREFHEFGNKKIWGNCFTVYHSMFGPVSRQNSNLRCVVGNHLNIAWGKNLPVLPHIVLPHVAQSDLRKILSIPKDAFVFGRHGGFNTFDIPFVKNTVIDLLKKRSDCYFVFLNTSFFYKHKRIIYLPVTTDTKKISQFIDTCDVMLHAREVGETFGMACAEFSAANKPVITCLCGDQEHIKILGKSALLYKNKEELMDIMMSIKKEDILNKNWNKYQEFSPQNVMNRFEEICLSNRKYNLVQKTIIGLKDIKAELIFFLKKLKRRIRELKKN